MTEIEEHGSQLEALTNAVETLANQVSGVDGKNGLRGEVRGLRDETRAKVAGLRWAVALACIAAALGLIASLAGLGFYRSFENDRTQRAYGSCVQYNADRKVSRNSKIQDAKDLVTASLKAKTFEEAYAGATPETKKSIDDYLARKNETNKISFPYRDCTANGIKKYLKHPPANPALTDK